MGFRGGRMRAVFACMLAAVVMWASGEPGWTQDATTKTGTQAGADAHVRILREIRDPHSGARWLVTADPDNPAGPGRVVLAGGAGRAEAPVPVIHQGDRVVVEEHTAAADGSMEATALEPASAGSGFAVRLRVGGRVLRAVALAPGRAALVGSIPAGKGRR